MSETTQDKMNFDYDGRTFSFAGLVFVNLILQILTLGIFRFWARTRERRFLWSHVSLGDDRLEYTGKGLELFLGFLIVMVVLIPIGAIFQGLSLAVGDSETGIIIVTVLYITGLMFLIHLAIYRTRRYRLSRTLWRGIRGTLTGSPVRYALVAMAWLPAVVLSLGLAAPFMRIALMNRELNNMHLGDRPFVFDGRARDLFAYWIVPWLTLLALIAGYAGMMYLISDATGVNPYDPDANPPDPSDPVVGRSRRRRSDARDDAPISSRSRARRRGAYQHRDVGRTGTLRGKRLVRKARGLPQRAATAGFADAARGACPRDRLRTAHFRERLRTPFR